MCDFIDNVIKISQFINSSEYNGEDVMMLFFNEFNRGSSQKQEYGQIFTPHHIARLMYHIAGVTHNDRVLDAACGSGSLLMASLDEMLNEMGERENKEALLDICNNRLFGVEISKDLFTLACANMLIHKDGKSNLIQADTREKDVCEWIKSKNITKVLMNPPYENKYGVYEIIENVLNNVSEGAMCAFLLPVNKLEAGRKQVEKWLEKHSLLKIIRLPHKTFSRSFANTRASIFLFKAHEPQNNKKIFTCHIKEDGLETIVKKGRRDIKGKWENELKPYWLNVIEKQGGDATCQWLKPSEHLDYQAPKKPFSITEKEFKKAVLDYLLFENNIDKKDFEKIMLETFLYESNFDIESKRIKFNSSEHLHSFKWQEFKIGDLFEKINLKKLNPLDSREFRVKEKDELHPMPAVSSKVDNNGVMYYVGKNDYETTQNKIVIIDKGNVATGLVYYHEKEFAILNSAYAITLKLNQLEKRNICLFFVVILQKAIFDFFDWYNKATWGKVKERKISLPVNNNGEINFEFMENFIKGIQQEMMKHVEIYNEIKLKAYEKAIKK